MVNVGLFMCIKQLGWKNVFFFQQDCAFWCWSPASPWTDHCRPQACEDCSFGQNAGGKKCVDHFWKRSSKKTRARPRVRVQFVNKYQKAIVKRKKLAE